MTGIRDRHYLVPCGLVSGPAAQVLVLAGKALPLAGGPLAFGQLLVRHRTRPPEIVSVSDLKTWMAGCEDALELARLLERLIEPRPDFAQLPMDRPHIMGVVNVTPDSFSDGGQFIELEQAITHCQQLKSEGAAILDIGGESTRPGATRIDEQTEIQRIAPLFHALQHQGWLLSIDTRKAAVMEAALDLGAGIINDIQALEGDRGALAVAASSRAFVVLMHAQGEPQVMQVDPRYDDVLLDVYDYLEHRITMCEAAGISRQRLAIDPGIGFGKTLEHNLHLLHNLALFHGLGVPILVGLSRKSMISKLSNQEMVHDRLPGSIAGALWCLSQGCQILRVHDVGATQQAIKIWQAIQAG